MIKETLIQIGFTRNEAKVYLALVELGPQPANIIAKKVGLERTATYPTLKSLLKKSLISSFIKNGIQFFAVSDTANLLDFVERKRRFIEHQRDFVIDILPKMENLRGSVGAKPRVHYYEGPEGVEVAMRDCLKKEKSLSRVGDGCSGCGNNCHGDCCLPILCIDSAEGWLQSGMGEFIKEFNRERILIEKIPMKTLAKDTAEARCFFDEYLSLCCGDVPCTELSEVRYVVDVENLFGNIIHIYDNKVAIVSPKKGFEFGVLIESQEFCRTQRSLFELAWEGAKRVE